MNSPIGKLTPQQVMYAARRLEDMVVGGITINDNLVFVTTAMPLDNIDASEITDSIERIVNIADRLEADILGTDEF